MVSRKILLWCVLLQFIFICSISQENVNIIPLGSNITAGNNSSYWLSPSREFAFGFYPLSSTGLFLVGIWFDKIPEKTLVWSANRDDPVPARSKVSLTLSGRLALTDTNGTEFVLYNGTRISHAAMQDDGNFVLTNSSSGVLWQSFDFPTDTILPGQFLDMGQKLFSSANGTVDYSTGKYRLEMQTDGNVVLSAYRTTDFGYWNAQTINNNSVRLVFKNTTATLFIVNGSSIIYYMTASLPASVRDYYHRAMITDKGNFQQLFRSKVNGSVWDVAWQAITQPCIVNNICGVYGFCESPDNKEINCSCLPGYWPRDQHNPSKGCYPSVVKDFCDPNSSHSDVYVQRISNADFPNRDYAELERVFQANEEICRQEVLNDCLCEAAVLIGSTCFKKRMPIQNARSVDPDTNNMVAFLKISNYTTSENKNHSVSKGVLIAGVIVCSVLAPLFAAIAVYYQPFVQIHRLAKSPPKRKPIELNLRAFSFQQLSEATNGFKNKLGQGASAAVYSGILKLEDEEVEVAVKQLGNGIEQGDDKEFLAEVRVIGLTHHKNLARLLGFCNEKNHRLLVYELMKNGAVSSLIFWDGKRPSWKLRSDMVLGTARGLLYLHEECENQIIHCDIKPQNVLLDKNYTAKIADFGLAKLLKKDQTRTSTNVRGTTGYMAPEWLKNVPVTTKVDIYSFGVLLLEIIFCQRHMELNLAGEENEELELILVDWVLHCVRNEMLRTVVSHDEEIMCDFHNFERMTVVGLWCLCPEPNLRPSAAKLVQMLEGTIEIGVPPMVDTTI
ncbi:G-type lectin S-receptor-like serine/threonine-protein kinase LECRK1 [Lycium ferocissimum]|uniref:G-type lectin S-receptor-like serine/threonine-protein kinase LECRK1 n=1 Tax=Lycium ferocissimum TaxID=112874 RepID=UPI0028167B25|nr:G-type lectin S-receptor-like serine/threonine-protein kinase LECRK1 [Lycium ferocissimum]